MLRMLETNSSGPLHVSALSQLRAGVAVVLFALASSMAVASVEDAPDSGMQEKAQEAPVQAKQWFKERDLEVRSAKWPVEIDVEFSMRSGAPRINEEALNTVLEVLEENRRRLVTLNFKGAPLVFSRLPRSTREQLVERSGEQIRGAYNVFVAGQVKTFIDGVRAAKPKAPLAVKGVPFEGRTRESQAANENYSEVIGKLSAFVASNSVVVGRNSREKSLVVRSFAESLRLADGRAVIYRANDDWRMALPTGTLAKLNEENANGQMKGLEQDVVGSRLTSGAADDGVIRSSASSGTPAVVPVGNAGSAQSLGRPSGTVGGGSPQPHSGGSGGSAGGGSGGGSSAGGGSGGGSAGSGESAGPDSDSSQADSGTSDSSSGEANAEEPESAASTEDDDPQNDPPAEESNDSSEQNNEEPVGDAEEDDTSGQDESEEGSTDGGSSDDGSSDDGSSDDGSSDDGSSEDGSSEDGSSEDGSSDDGSSDDGSSDDGSSEDGSSEDGSSDDGSSDDGSSEDGSSEDGSSDDGSSDDGSSDDGSSDDGSSDDGSSEDGSSEDGSSEDGSSDDGSSEDGSSDDGSSDDGSSEDGSSDDGSSDDGSSDDGSSEDGSSEDGSSEDGSSDDGSSDDGSSEDGSSDDGSSDDGSSDDGSSDDGSSEDGSSDDGSSDDGSSEDGSSEDGSSDDGSSDDGSSDDGSSEDGSSDDGSSDDGSSDDGSSDDGSSDGGSSDGGSSDDGSSEDGSDDDWDPGDEADGSDDGSSDDGSSDDGSSDEGSSDDGSSDDGSSDDGSSDDGSSDDGSAEDDSSGSDGSNSSDDEPVDEGPNESGQTLVPGSGFSGSFPELGPIGSVDDPGGDAKVIARWNFVTDQEPEGILGMGVVAFHYNGIDRVDFFLDGGEAISVSEMAHNPESNTWEYWVNFDASLVADGRHEIRAIAYPKSSGIPRVLQGDIDEFVHGCNGCPEEDLEGWSDTVVNGNHSMYVWSNRDQSLESRTFFVDANNGNDTNGNGSSSLPYATIKKVINANYWNQPVFNERVLIKLRGTAENPGNYIYGGPNGSGGSYAEQGHKRWLTIMADDTTSVQRENVRIVGNQVSGNNIHKLSNNIYRVRFYNVTLGEPNWQNPKDIEFKGYRAFHWFDHCYHSSDPAIYSGQPQTNDLDYGFTSMGDTQGTLVTNCEFGTSTNGMRAAIYLANTSFVRIARSIYGGPMGVNVVCTEGWFEATHDSGSYEFHGDVTPWQSFDERAENKIVYNYNIHGWSNQAMYGEEQPISSAYKMDNIAIVNASVGDLSGSTANWSKWERRTNHFLVWHCTFVNHGWEFLKGTDPTNGSTKHGKNFSFCNNVITKMSNSHGSNAFKLSEYDGADLDKILVLNNHFINSPTSTTYVEDVPVQDLQTYSIGNPGFVDESSYDFRPFWNSIINNRAVPLVPADAAGVERPLDSEGRSAIGSWNSSS